MIAGVLPSARGTDRALFVVLGALVLGTVGLYWPSLSALAELWSHPERRTYQHGFLIAAISLWLLFRERHRAVAAVSGANPALLAGAAVASAAWAVAWNANLQVIHFLLWPLAFWAAATGWMGWRAGRVLAAPAAFLYFALPIWDALTPALQWATVLANRVLAGLFGMPVLIDGNTIHIPQGSFDIAGGCSGLNYLVVGLAISALLGEINRDSPERRLLLIVLCGVLALFSNWLRVFIIIYAGHVSDMQHYLVKVDHYNFGWVLFAFVLAFYFLLVRRLPPAGEESETGPAAGRVRRANLTPAIAAFAALSLGPALASAGSWAAGNAEGTIGIRQLDLPGASRWEPAPAVGGWVPIYPRSDAETLVEYSKGEQRVSVYSATYVRQAQGRELVGHDSSLTGRDRGLLSARVHRLVDTAPAIPVAEAEWTAAGGARAVLWWTYRVGSRDFNRDLPAQLWYGVASLWSMPVSAIVALRAECRPDCAEARRTLEEFSRDALPDLLAGAGRSGD